MYSCAWFPHPEASLAEAQQARLDRICRALELGPDDHLLEIGTGWGGLAVHAASRFGCRVTTTTISQEQREGALRRIADAGVEDRVTVLLEDYRDLRGRYDKLVSLEMIEAVGWQYFDVFFRRCSELLTPEGLIFLQAIVIDDRVYELEKAARSFANTLIFPGGCLPSVEVIQRCVAGQTDMSTVWLDDISAHYAETLKIWRQRFVANSDLAAELGYDEPFRRLWTLWLAMSEAGFRERRIRDVQMLFAKPGRIPSLEESRSFADDARGLGLATGRGGVLDLSGALAELDGDLALGSPSRTTVSVQLVAGLAGVDDGDHVLHARRSPCRRPW